MKHSHVSEYVVLEELPAHPVIQLQNRAKGKPEHVTSEIFSVVQLIYLGQNEKWESHEVLCSQVLI